MMEMEAEFSLRDKYFLHKAMAVATMSECRNRHGAIIVVSGKVISVGVNIDKNSPLCFDNERDVKMYASIHAEWDAIRQLKKVPKNATIYVARVNNFGAQRLSRPCEGCQEKISRAGIRTVFWTLSGSGWGSWRERR